MLPLALLADTPSGGQAAAWLNQRPGLVLYVTATLLPLLSFLLLLLMAGVRCLVRTDREEGVRRRIYDMFGGGTDNPSGGYIATVAIAGSFVLALIGFFMHSADHAPRPEERWSDRTEFLRIGWYPGKAPENGESDPRGAVALEVGYKVDHLTTVMFLMVALVSMLIHIFSLGYMSDELDETVEDHQVHTAEGHLRRRGRFARFFMYLSLFCFSMLNLVVADNLFQVFISWELVGICSYLLIGHYYERQSASNAANKAFITNRIGDAGFIIGLLIVWTYIGTFNFDEIFARVRAPLADHHGKEAELGGRFVRVNVIKSETGKDGVTWQEVEVADDGQYALLMGHLHAEDLARVARSRQTGEVIIDPNTKQPKRPVVTGVSDRPIHIQNMLDEGTPNTIPYWLLVAAGLGIFMGCVGKSAQFPLQVWLPDAMEGPTPVSALIHAATMVAAGVYLVGRAYPMFTQEVKLVIAYTGAITLFIAATIALVMNDIKKVLAYSTVSQLGYMMLGLGVGGWVAGLFHLLTHAFFKALLFLCSGSVIYGCHHEQDMNKMGGLLKKMPITAFTMLAGVLAIAGTPLFSGWYSKDAILASSFGFVYFNGKHVLLFLLPLLTAGLTTFYMFRMWFMTFTGTPRDEYVHENAHESPKVMTVPLIVLAVFSVCVAWGWPVWNAEASALEHHLHEVIKHDVKAGKGYMSVLADYGGVFPNIETEFWPAARSHPGFSGERAAANTYHEAVGLLALGAAGLGFLFAYLVYIRRVFDPADAVEQFPGVYRFLTNKWGFDDLYSGLVVRPAVVVARWCRGFDLKVIDGVVDWLGRSTIRTAKWDGQFDNGVIDGIANLIANVTYAVGAGLRRVQTGYLRSYILFLVIAAIGLFALLRYLIGIAAAGP